MMSATACWELFIGAPNRGIEMEMKTKLCRISSFVEFGDWILSWIYGRMRRRDGVAVLCSVTGHRRSWFVGRDYRHPEE
jgi:hypothetical protein